MGRPERVLSRVRALIRSTRKTILWSVTTIRSKSNVCASVPVVSQIKTPVLSRINAIITIRSSFTPCYYQDSKRSLWTGTDRASRYKEYWMSGRFRQDCRHLLTLLYHYFLRSIFSVL